MLHKITRILPLTLILLVVLIHWSSTPVSSAQSTPVLSVSPTELSVQIEENTNSPVFPSITISNDGNGRMNFEVIDDADWLFSESSGVLEAGSSTEVSFLIDQFNLPSGELLANITVTAEGAENSPINVVLRINSAQGTMAEQNDSVASILNSEGLAINKEANFIVFRDATDPNDFWGMAIDLENNNLGLVGGAEKGKVAIGQNTPFAKLTVFTENINDGIWLANPTHNDAVGLLTNLGTGSWNPITQEGDQILLWKGDTPGNPGGGLVIAPWSNSRSGARFSPSGDLTVHGNFLVTGVKSFVQDHPTEDEKSIVYVSLEGPEAGTYLRGTADLINGEAVVELPEHFAFTTNDAGLTVQLTPVGQYLELFVMERTPQRLVIREANGKSGEFDYFVQGIRRGFENHNVIQTND